MSEENDALIERLYSAFARHDGDADGYGWAARVAARRQITAGL